MTENVEISTGEKYKNEANEFFKSKIFFGTIVVILNN